MKLTRVFIVPIVLLTALLLMFGESRASSHSLPRGFLDFASQNSIYGWAYDPDAGAASITVHIYIDGKPTVALTADQRRDDLVAAGVASDPFHGFSWTPPPLSPGTHRVQAYAINQPSGINPELQSAKTITVSGGGFLPSGVLDIATPNYVFGWAYDKDAGTDPIHVHIYIDGVHTGTVLANQRRDDLVAAGVAPDAFHGYSWIPPTLPFGNHSISAWAINTPLGTNPQLRSSPKITSVAQGEFVGLSVIENSVVKVGAHLGWGGAIAHVSHRDINLVDDHDTGRLIQASFYDSKESYPSHDDPLWGWNPVQGGDKHNHGSRVLEFSKTANSIYTKSQPLQWNPDNKGGGVNTSVQSLLTLETWITLSDQFPQMVTVRQKVTSQENVSRRGDHEVPAMFLAPSFQRLVGYQGTSPWTNGAVSQPTFAELPNIYTFYPARERWASLVNPQAFGMTLYVPHHEQEGFNSYWINRVTNYLRPALTTTFTSNTPWEIIYYLIVGNWADARSLIYQLHASGI